MKRVLSFLFNTLRNLSLVFCIALFGTYYLLDHGYIADQVDIQTETAAAQFSMFSAASEDFSTKDRRIKVGRNGRNEKFIPEDFVYARTTGSGKVSLLLHGGEARELRDGIKSVRSRFPDHAPHLFQTGGLLLNLNHVRQISTDVHSRSYHRSIKVTVGNGCGLTSGLTIPDSQTSNFDRAWVDFSEER